MHTSNIEHEWFVPGKLLWASPMRGVEVTELGDGGAYFAPPGDFSKVDFSACQKQELEQYTYDLTMLHVYGKARIPATKIGELPRIDFEVEGDDNGKVQAVTRVWVNGKLQPLSSKADAKPKTAQHSKQAKPALPSLMTEAGERYQGLGWCDE